MARRARVLLAQAASVSDSSNFSNLLLFAVRDAVVVGKPQQVFTALDNNAVKQYRSQSCSRQASAARFKVALVARK